MLISLERRVDLLVCSLPLHRHSYIGFILTFASSIHNKQLPEKKFLFTKARKWGARTENGGLRQVKKTSLSKEDLPIPGRDREGE